MSTSKHTKQPEPSRGKLYAVLGIILAIAIAALLVWDSGFLTRSAKAVTIGDETFSVAEVNFYYYSARSQEANMSSMYAQMGYAYPYDYTVADNLQMYDEEQTYADYFREMAIEEMQSVKLLCDEAKAEGFTLSEEAQANYESTLASSLSQITYSSLMQGTSESSYIKRLYGPDVTMSMFKNNLEQQTLASEYAKSITEAFSYDAAELEAYYEENSVTLDTFDYRSVFISGAAAPSVNEETGEETGPTEEQTAAAMDAAKESADALAARVRSGADFNTAAMDYVDEATREELADPTYGLVENVLGSGLSLVFSDWMAEDGRKTGDVGVVEESSGYHVIVLLDRFRDNESVANATAWSVLVTAETTEATDEEGNVTTAPTEAQLEAAYAEALAFQAAWDESSDRSEDAFRALVPEPEAGAQDAQAEEDAANPEDGETSENGEEAALPEEPVAPEVQILTEVARGSYGAAFDEFVFASGQATDITAIVPVEASDGTVTGYRLVYLVEFGPILWESIADTALRNLDYADWYSELQTLSPVTELEGFTKVGL